MSGGGGGGGYRDSIPIPKTARKVIQDIREITRKQHSDEEIYAVLKECSMDPNETAQRLLFLDTFHEVKKRRDKRKDSISSSRRTSQDAVSVTGKEGRGMRSGRTNYLHRTSAEVGSGRNDGGSKENTSNKSKERDSVLYPVQESQKTKHNATPSVARALAVVSNGPMSSTNGSSRNEQALKSLKDVAEDNSAGVAPSAIASAASTQTRTFSSVVRAEHQKSRSVSKSDQTVSTSVLAQSDSPPEPGVVDTINRKGGSLQTPGEVTHYESVSQSLDSPDSLKNGLAGTEIETPIHQKASEETVAGPDQLSEAMQPPSSSVASTTIHDTAASQESVPKVEVDSQLPPESGIPNGQHVTFPSHIRVPRALKNGLTFGSFSAGFGLEIKDDNGSACNNKDIVALSKEGDEISNGSSSNSSVFATDQGIEQSLLVDAPSAEISVPSDVPSTEYNVPSGVISNFDQSKQETLFPSEPPQNLTLQNTSNYTLGSEPPEKGNQLVQHDGTDPQDTRGASLQNSADGNSSVLTTPSPSPPLTQPGLMQGSVTMPPPPVPLFRQPYPPNYFPYGHYIPLIVPQAQHFLSPNGLPQQPSAGNLYMPPQAAGAGLKLPLSQLKPGTSAGNQTPIAPGYNFYSSSPVGYNLGPAATLGTTPANEDLAASQLKENHVYLAGQMNEGSAAWIPKPGQDMHGLPHNSLYNILPQGQHLGYSPSLAVAGHGPYAGIFQPAQTMAAPNMHTLLQHSQATVGAIEAVAPQNAAYQQAQHAQHAQMWSTNGL